MIDYKELKHNLDNLLLCCLTDEERETIKQVICLIDKIEQGELVELPFLLKTSSKFACVVWKDNQGVIHKTHTFPIEQAEAKLKEKQNER